MNRLGLRWCCRFPFRWRRFMPGTAFASCEPRSAWPRSPRVPADCRRIAAARASAQSGNFADGWRLGYLITFLLLARYDPDAAQAAVFGAIPICVGIGYFIDVLLVHGICIPGIGMLDELACLCYRDFAGPTGHQIKRARDFRHSQRLEKGGPSLRSR